MRLYAVSTKIGYSEICFSNYEDAVERAKTYPHELSPRVEELTLEKLSPVYPVFFEDKLIGIASSEDKARSLCEKKGESLHYADFFLDEIIENGLTWEVSFFKELNHWNVRISNEEGLPLPEKVSSVFSTRYVAWVKAHNQEDALQKGKLRIENLKLELNEREDGNKVSGRE